MSAPDTDRSDSLVEAFCEAGLIPADMIGAPWIGERYEAGTEITDGLILVTTWDTEITLHVTTPSGVIRSEARFDMTDLGLAMLTAAIGAITGGQA